MRAERRSPVTRMVRSPDWPTTVSALVCGCSAPSRDHGHARRGEHLPARLAEAVAAERGVEAAVRAEPRDLRCGDRTSARRLVERVDEVRDLTDIRHRPPRACVTHST